MKGALIYRTPKKDNIPNDVERYLPTPNYIQSLYEVSTLMNTTMSS